MEGSSASWGAHVLTRLAGASRPLREGLLVPLRGAAGLISSRRSALLGRSRSRSRRRGSSSSPSTDTVITEIAPETAKGRWEIRDFSLLDKSPGAWIESPELVEVAGVRFTLKAYWGGQNTHPGHQEGFFSIFCSPIAMLGPARVKFNITVCSKDGAAVVSRESSMPESFIPGRREGWGHVRFGELAELWECLVDDSLVVEVSLAAWRPGQDPVRLSHAATHPSGYSAAPLPSAVAAVTEVASETAKAVWELRGFSRMSKERGAWMYSPELVEAAGVRFFLAACWGGDWDAAEGHYSLWCGSSSSWEPLMVDYVVTVFNRHGVCIHKEKIHRDRGRPLPPVHGNHYLGWPNFARTDALETNLVDDSFFIELSVTAWRPRQEQVRVLLAAPGYSGGAAIQGESDGERGALGEDLAAFLAGGQATDVELVDALAEQPIRAHRFLLAARSPVFNRMLLESGMREAQAGARIPIVGADGAILEKFVRFLYTDKMDAGSPEEDPEALCHLLALGHRYEVRSLVRQCSARLTITEDTAIERLIMSEQFGVAALKENVMDYVCGCRSRLARVQETEAFERLLKGYPRLVKELFARATHTAAETRPPALAGAA